MKTFVLLGLIVLTSCRSNNSPTNRQNKDYGVSESSAIGEHIPSNFMDALGSSASFVLQSSQAVWDVGVLLRKREGGQHDKPIYEADIEINHNHPVWLLFQNNGTGTDIHQYKTLPLEQSPGMWVEAVALTPSGQINNSDSTIKIDFQMTWGSFSAYKIKHTKYRLLDTQILRRGVGGWICAADSNSELGSFLENVAYQFSDMQVNMLMLDSFSQATFKTKNFEEFSKVAIEPRPTAVDKLKSMFPNSTSITLSPPECYRIILSVPD